MLKRARHDKVAHLQSSLIKENKKEQGNLHSDPAIDCTVSETSKR